MDNLNEIQTTPKENTQKTLQPKEGELRQYRDGTYKYENGKFRKLKLETKKEESQLKETPQEKIKLKETSQKEISNFSQKIVEFKKKNYPIEYEEKRIWYKNNIHQDGEEDSLSFTNSPCENYPQEIITIIEPKDFNKIKFTKPKTQGNLIQGEKVEFELNEKKEIGWIKDFPTQNDIIIWNEDKSISANKRELKVKKYKELTEQDIQKAILAKRFPEEKAETLNRYMQNFGSINFSLNVLKCVKNDIRKSELQQELEEIRSKIKRVVYGYEPDAVVSVLIKRFGIIGTSFKSIIKQ